MKTFIKPSQKTLFKTPLSISMKLYQTGFPAFYMENGTLGDPIIGIAVSMNFERIGSILFDPFSIDE